MTYRELLDLTKKHPNPFWNKEQHNKEFEIRYKRWLGQEQVNDQKPTSNR